MVNSQHTIPVSPVFKDSSSLIGESETQKLPSEEKRVFSAALVFGIVIIILLIIGLLTSMALVNRRTNIFSRAYGGTSTLGEVELANSYIFASPLKALANRMDKIRVTVFVLDSQGKGVFGKMVTLAQEGPLSISPVQPTTDELGRAVFDISSTSTGLFFLEARVGGKILSQKVGVSFE